MSSVSPLPKSVLQKLPEAALCDTPLFGALWGLKAHKLIPGVADFADANAISEILLRGEISLPALSILRALARAGSAVAKRGQGHEASFRIVAEGERLLEEKTRPCGPIAFRLSGKAPWSDRRFVIKHALQKSSGDVLILDKYFGEESLDFLQGFQKARNVRFLTCHPNKGLSRLQREVATFKREFPNSQFKACPASHELHDRYILFAKEAWFVGHGIKDLGAKESFVLILQDPFGKDIRSTLQQSFESRWAASPDFEPRMITRKPYIL